MKNLVMALLVISYVVGAEASAATGGCSLTVNREPCPGHETEAWYPYNGVNPTTHDVQAKDQARCNAAAQRMATIARKGVLKKVTATPTFNGSVLAPVISESSCEPSSKNRKSAESSDPRLSKGAVFQGTSKKK